MGNPKDAKEDGQEQPTTIYSLEKVVSAWSSKFYQINLDAVHAKLLAEKVKFVHSRKG